MDKKIILWIIIGGMFIASLFLIFKAGAGNSIETVGAASSAAKTAASSYSGGMVGGC